MSQTWTERKEALKQEIVDYFWSLSQDKEVVKKACAFVKFWGEVQAEMVEEGVSQQLDRLIANDEQIVEAFSPAHREKVAVWVNAYAELALEALQYLEEQRTWNVCWARDDFELKDYESTLPNGEIQVCSDKIRVLSFEFVEGFSNSLPKKGKKSIGKLHAVRGGWEWNYPLSELEAVKKIGLPVIWAIDAVRPES